MGQQSIMIFINWLILLISVSECSRITLINKISKNLRKGVEFCNSSVDSQKQNIPKKRSTPKKEPKIFNFQCDFSTSSMMTGVFLTIAGFYYFENQNLNRLLVRSQLLSGEIDGGGGVSLDKFVNDEVLFVEAIKRRNQKLCLLLLRSGAKPMILNDSGDNLLVKLIENDMIEVLEFLLNRPDAKLAIDFMDTSTGKTALLAAIQAKMYPQAKKLLEMGAKPMIPSTPKFHTRTIQDFINEINENSEEAEELLRCFDKLFKNKN